jgi:hypothetical protein
MGLPYNPVILLPCGKELKTGTEESIHACMFIATRFTTAKRQK